MNHRKENPNSEIRKTIESRQGPRDPAGAGFRFSKFDIRALCLVALSSFILLHSSFAGNVFPFRIIAGNTTGEVDETQFSTGDITLSLTNLPGGGRRAIIGILGGGGGSNNTILVQGLGLRFDNLGGGTNSLSLSNTTISAGSYGDSTHIGSFTVGADGRLTAASSTTISFPAAGTTNTWYTNGVLWATSDAFSFSNASSVVGLGFTNVGGVPTIYLVPD